MGVATNPTAFEGVSATSTPDPGESDVNRIFGGYGVSILVHALVLVCLLFVKFAKQEPPELVLVTSEMMEAPEDIDIVDALTVEDSTTKVVAAAFKPGSPGMSGAARLDDAKREMETTRLVSATLNSEIHRPPLHGELRNFNLDSPLENSPGMFLGNGGSDASAVDRLTQEIKAKLEKGRVLVCWVLDSTYSMRERREAVIKRFDKVYGELNRLGVDRERALLTSVMMYGKTNSALVKEPLADIPKLLASLKGVKDDESGVENIFAAVRKACEEYRSYQVQQRRQLMIVVLTDERGDDAGSLEETIAICRRNKASVYVLGPMAPFGRSQVMVDWTDKETGEKFPVPTYRGPETVEPEHLDLPYWGSGEQYRMFGSGFGPYGLARLVRETDGLYFIDSSDMRGLIFNPDDMREYRPDYMPFKDYLTDKRKHPLRAAIVEAAMESQGKNAPGEPPFLFPAENIGARLTDAQRIVARTEFIVNKSLGSLREVEKHRAKETSRRWQANFDLVMGRLLANKVRTGEYNWALAQMKVNPKTNKEKNMNAWRLAPDKEIAFGKKEIADAKKSETNVRKSNPKATEEAKKDAEKALTYLQQVVKNHPDTPWAKMAERELQTPLGFKWVEAYLPPPPKAGERPTPAQQQEMERQKKRAEAMKRVPKDV
jgi:hypothetical protein